MDTGARGHWMPDFTDGSPWRWEWWKVGLNSEDLFTTLQDEYNTVLCRIQGDVAFHHDDAGGREPGLVRPTMDSYEGLVSRIHGGLIMVGGSSELT